MESRCSQVSNHNILSTQTPGAGWRVGSSGMFRSKPLRNLLQTMEVSTRFAGGSKTGLESLSLSLYIVRLRYITFLPTVIVI